MAFVPANPAAQWSNPLDVTVTAPGTVPVLFVSTDDGPIPAFANTLTGMVSVSGWTAVTNPLDATPGTLEEDDPTYLARQAEEVAATGASTLASLSADLLDVTGVVSVLMLENAGLTTDVNGLPPKSFCPVIYDGAVPAASNDQIAQVIWGSKPAGMQTYGSMSVTVQDSRGVDQVVSFSRSNVRDVYVSTRIVLAAGASLGTVGPLVQEAIAAKKPAPGQGITQLSLMAAALSVEGVVDVASLALDFVSSPTATANLPAGPFDVLALDTSRISVST